jgi:hypothetical protein
MHSAEPFSAREEKVDEIYTTADDLTSLLEDIFSR